MKHKIMSSIIVVSMLLIVSAIPVLADGQSVNLVTDIKITGNEHIPTEDIKAVINTEVGEKVGGEKLQKDLNAIYQMGYFTEETKIIPKNYLGGLRIIYKVVERPVINEIIYEGNTKVSDDKLKEFTEINIDEVLNINLLFKTANNIRQYYQEEGMIKAQIADYQIKENRLYLNITEGLVGEIKIKGNEQTRDYVILRELDVTSGDIFDLDEIKEDMRDLYNLNLFKGIEPKLYNIEGEENTYGVEYNLEERKSGKANLGVGFNTRDRWLGTLSYEERNFLGRNQDLSFSWEFGKSQNYDINFYDPWAFGDRISFGIGLYNRTTKDLSSKIEELNDESYSYSKMSRGGNIRIGKQFSDHLSAQAKFKVENTLTDWYTNVPGTLDDKEGNTRSLTLTTLHDTTIDRFNPNSGGKEKLSIEYAGQALGGDYNFTKYILDVRRYYEGFRPDHIWALRAVGGGSSGKLPLHEEMRVGGSETLRGFELGAFRGDKMLFGNAEYKIKIVDKVQAVIFADMGKAWKEEEAMDLGELTYSGGLGLRLTVPFLGQVRLDYGIGKDEPKPRPHFSIGQTF